MSATHLVPKDKSDLEAVRRAAEAGCDEIALIAEELLEWLQDGNWPVAREVAEVLAKAGVPVVPHVLAVLRGEDAVWKYWVLTMLVPRLDHGTRSLLLDECRRLAEQPGAEDLQEEVDVAAREVVDSVKG